jgi:hypothetical protein
VSARGAFGASRPRHGPQVSHDVVCRGKFRGR